MLFRRRGVTEWRSDAGRAMAAGASRDPAVRPAEHGAGGARRLGPGQAAGRGQGAGPALWPPNASNFCRRSKRGVKQNSNILYYSEHASQDTSELCWCFEERLRV